MLAATVVLALAAAAFLAGSAAAKGWWTPPQHLTWYWQLDGTVNNNEPVAVYDIDGFENSAAEVTALHAQGKHVICYIDVGTAPPPPPPPLLFPPSPLPPLPLPHQHEDFRPDYLRSFPEVGPAGPPRHQWLPRRGSAFSGRVPLSGRKRGRCRGSRWPG